MDKKSDASMESASEDSEESEEKATQNSVDSDYKPENESAS